MDFHFIEAMVGRLRVSEAYLPLAHQILYRIPKDPPGAHPHTPTTQMPKRVIAAGASVIIRPICN